MKSAPKWQPINTAPKHKNARYLVAKKVDDDWWVASIWYEAGSDLPVVILFSARCYTLESFTHWMPLPELPK